MRVYVPTFILALVASFTLMAQSNLAQGDMITLSPSIDLDVNSAGSISDNAFLNINGNNSGSNQRRALLQFDLSAPQLNNAMITSAILTFDQNELGSADQYGVARLLRVGTQSWTGSTAGSTLFNIANDGNSVFLTSFSPATNPPPGLYAVDITSTVQGWIDNTFDNYGLSLTATEGAFSGVERQFDSSTGSIAPSLFIEFTPAPPVPEPATGLLLGLGTLALLRMRRKKGANNER